MHHTLSNVDLVPTFLQRANVKNITPAGTFATSLSESYNALYHCRTITDNFSVQTRYGIGGLLSSLNNIIAKLSNIDLRNKTNSRRDVQRANPH